MMKTTSALYSNTVSVSIYVSSAFQCDIQTGIDLLPLGTHEYNLYVTVHYICLMK